MNHDRHVNDADVDSDDNNARRPPPSYLASFSPTPATSPITRRGSFHPHPHPPVRPPVQHVYSLFDSRNTPWASLKLLSNVGSPRFLPAYFEGQQIHGTLELDLRKPETILAISLTISGTIIAANAPDPRVFWELTRVLWSADMGDPHPAAGHSSSSNSNLGKAKAKSNTKLVGAYSWSFAIPLPSTCTVTLRSKQPPVSLPLPPSFSEKGASQFINYEITVRIRRGPLRIDSKLGTHFGFAPRTRPPAPSHLRQLAYQENSPLLDPEGDPDGWTVLPPIIVRGKLFGVRVVEAVCTFALALPLTYARGHPLPLMLTVSCTDAQALDLVFTPQNVSVHLIREVCYDTDCSEASRKGWGSGGLDSSPSDRSLGVTASSPSTFNPRAFLPRAVPSSESSYSGPASAGASASLARMSSLYSQPSASTSVAASSMTTVTSPSTSAFSALSSLSFGSSKSNKKSMGTGTSTSTSKKKPPKVSPKLALNGARTPVTSAVWWPSHATTTRTHSSRCMEGEILLPKDLVPSFEFGGFCVKYALALLPFQAPGFELYSPVSPPTSNPAPCTPPSPLTLTSEPLLLSPISIASLPFYPSLSPRASAGAVGGAETPGAPPGIPLPTGAGHTSNPRYSRAPPDIDIQAQRAAHAERVRKPVVWGLFNQFVNGGPSTVSGSASGARD